MRTLLLQLVLLFSLAVSAQNSYYGDPLKIPMFLSGSFAELRSNHFHSGIDIKTQGISGFPVYAVADGFVSRISVSPSGFGKALYIDHPNGTTSVYGHLDHFSSEIQKYVTEKQYELKSFKVDLNVPALIFPVKKGQEVARSGNTGSSGGPHLHFEIRDTESEEPLNPLDYGFPIKDQIPPRIFSLLVVPLSDTSHVAFGSQPVSYPIVYSTDHYIVKDNIVIPLYGPVGFAIQANDFMDGTNNKCGISSMNLTVDDDSRFAYHLTRFAFDDSRFINSHIVYDEYVKTQRRYVKAWIDPGNRLPVYTYDLSQGEFKVLNGQHRVQIEVADAYGNSARLNFVVEGKFRKMEAQKTQGAIAMNYNRENTFESENCVLVIPKGALYKDFDFVYREQPTTKAFYSDFECVHHNGVPLHIPATIRIKPRNLPERLQSKALVVNVDSGSGQPTSAGGTYQNGWVETEIRTLGMYALMVDTIAPVITPLSFENGALKESGRIRFKIADNLSGIKEMEGLIDNEWALFDYDAKTAIITHTFDKSRFNLGKRHTFKLTVTDYCGNTKVFETGFWK